MNRRAYRSGLCRSCWNGLAAKLAAGTLSKQIAETLGLSQADVQQAPEEIGVGFAPAATTKTVLEAEALKKWNLWVGRNAKRPDLAGPKPPMPESVRRMHARAGRAGSLKRWSKFKTKAERSAEIAKCFPGRKKKLQTGQRRKPKVIARFSLDAPTAPAPPSEPPVARPGWSAGSDRPTPDPTPCPASDRRSESLLTAMLAFAWVRVPGPDPNLSRKDWFWHSCHWGRRDQTRTGLYNCAHGFLSEGETRPQTVTPVQPTVSAR